MDTSYRSRAGRPVGDLGSHATRRPRDGGPRRGEPTRRCWVTSAVLILCLGGGGRHFVQDGDGRGTRHVLSLRQGAAHIATSCHRLLRRWCESRRCRAGAAKRPRAPDADRRRSFGGASSLRSQASRKKHGRPCVHVSSLRLAQTQQKAVPRQIPWLAMVRAAGRAWEFCHFPPAAGSAASQCLTIGGSGRRDARWHRIMIHGSFRLRLRDGIAPCPT